MHHGAGQAEGRAQTHELHRFGCPDMIRALPGSLCGIHHVAVVEQENPGSMMRA